MTRSELFQQLSAEQQRVRLLEQERDALLQEIQTLKTRVEAMVRERDAYQTTNEALQLELERIELKLKAKQREKVDPKDLQAAFKTVEQMITASKQEASEESAESPESTKSSSEQDTAGAPGGQAPPPETKEKSKPVGRSKIPDNLETHRIVLEPPAELREGKVCIGEETSYRIDYRPGCYVCLEIVRPKYASAEDRSQGVVEQEAPKTFLTGSKAGAGLVAKVIHDKFSTQQPLYRQEQVFRDEGLALARSTMCSWLSGAYNTLSPIVDAMLSQAQRQAHCIAMDATTVRKWANDRCKIGYFWVLVADQDHAIFRYTAKQTHNEPMSMLKKFSGYVLADASSVYNALFRINEEEDERSAEQLPTEVGCWSHARRYFFRALVQSKEAALIGLSFCNKLFAIEEQLKDAPPAKKLSIRQKQSREVLQALWQWREAQLSSSEVVERPYGKLAVALRYVGNHWEALNRFTQDGRLRIDNNISEVRLRHQKRGQDNWLFLGGDEGGHQNAAFVSLIMSARMHQLRVWPYLRDVLRVAPHWPKERMLELSPKYWTATHNRLNPAELEAPLGPLTVPPALDLS